MIATVAKASMARAYQNDAFGNSPVFGGVGVVGDVAGLVTVVEGGVVSVGSVSVSVGSGAPS